MKSIWDGFILKIGIKLVVWRGTILECRQHTPILFLCHFGVFGFPLDSFGLGGRICYFVESSDGMLKNDKWTPESIGFVMGRKARLWVCHAMAQLLTPVVHTPTTHRMMSICYWFPLDKISKIEYKYDFRMGWAGPVPVLPPHSCFSCICFYLRCCISCPAQVPALILLHLELKWLLTMWLQSLMHGTWE